MSLNITHILYCVLGALLLLGFFFGFDARVLTLSEIIGYFLTFFFLLLALSNCYHAFKILYQNHLGLIKKAELLQLQEQITAANNSNNEKLVNIPESTTASQKLSITEVLVLVCEGAAIGAVVAVV